METKTFDIAIIGAGSGGLTVAAVASQLGYAVVLFEKGEMGGDCLNYGCVPSKALISAAKKKLPFKEAMAHVHDVIAAIAPHDSQERFEKLGVTVVRHGAKFVNETTLEAGGAQYTARRIVVATGSRAFIPPIEGLDKTPYLTNETIFELKEQPEHLVVLGGGPIGVEMAQAFRRLGSKVTLVEAATGIMGKDDPEAVAVVKETLLEEGLEVLVGAKVVKTSKAGTGVTVMIETDGNVREIDASHLLVATGRAANVDGLGLEQAAIDFDRRGIKTDGQLRTTQKHVYAVGDVAGPYQFTHTAGWQATLFIQRSLFGNFMLKPSYHAVPWVTYTDPELAQVGMTEAQARDTFGGKLTVTKVNVAESDRAQAEGDTRGFVKVMSVKGVPVGVTLVGKDAGEHLAPWVFMVTHKMQLRKISSLILPYPTRSELMKKIVSAYYKETFLSKKTRTLSHWLFKLFG